MSALQVGFRWDMPELLEEFPHYEFSAGWEGFISTERGYVFHVKDPRSGVHLERRIKMAKTKKMDKIAILEEFRALALQVRRYKKP